MSFSNYDTTQGEGLRLVSGISVTRGSMESKHKMKRLVSQPFIQGTLFIAFKNFSFSTIIWDVK
jgi:hypothetical protein